METNLFRFNLLIFPLFIQKWWNFPACSILRWFAFSLLGLSLNLHKTIRAVERKEFLTVICNMTCNMTCKNYSFNPNIGDFDEHQLNPIEYYPIWFISLNTLYLYEYKKRLKTLILHFYTPYLTTELHGEKFVWSRIYNLVLLTST